MEEASFILHAAGLGLAHLFTWPTFPMMMVGIGVGLFLGIIPGLGGLVGLSLLIPFAITMDPVVGLSFLLGMTAVITQSDTIPAVLIGVPGTSASMATALDGFPMAKRGEAGRALCAAYFAGIFGMMIAAVEFMMILPVLRSVILSFGQPEFFMLILFGLLLTGSLAGKSMLRGLIMALAGLLLAMVSNATSSGFVRYAGDIVYLWDGVPLIPVVLGMFAIPEVIDMARRGSPISEVTVDTRASGVWAGFKDNVDNWWLVLKTSSLGAFVGFIPGLGSQVAEWMAYGAAISSDKDPESFGKGNVRGVIAPEAATAAQKPGGMIPSIAFGIPDNAGWALILSVLLVYGLSPGPQMLTTKLDITFSMVWVMVVANIIAAILQLILQRWLIKLCYLPSAIIVPTILAAMLIGAVMTTKSYGDVAMFFIAGLFGYVFKHADWPRIPLLMGLIMGALAERYLFLSMSLHGTSWLTDRPLVWVIGFMIFLSVFLKPIRNWLKPRKTAPSQPSAAGENT